MDPTNCGLEYATRKRARTLRVASPKMSGQLRQEAGILNHVIKRRLVGTFRRRPIGVLIFNFYFIFGCAQRPPVVHGTTPI